MFLRDFYQFSSKIQDNPWMSFHVREDNFLEEFTSRGSVLEIFLSSCNVCMLLFGDVNIIECG